ncbi:mechanosensitive ion channel family protein [Brevundimonas sp. P7753]|jgi:small-conductance mechanosensitive channel|uniref:mechanosensitive ion channel family protein n=1 Tax=Brevundimonas sp. P7753 TaxID=2726982 RepID=UPI0015B8DBB1|nr:mechanosensitive ion channel domain-containing protein [Brevundimonas sp. P7753]NWE51504.1 mechanosensitive ion channel [Brevundimonas sp. P7753]
MTAASDVIGDLGKLDDARIVDIGGSVLTLGGLVSAVIIIAAAIVVSWFITRGLRRLRLKAQRGAQALYLLEKLTGYAVIVFGVIVGLSSAGLNLSSLAVFAGAIGIGVGLGLQGVVKEFVSGIFLIFDRMVSVGDYVELESGTRGAIAEIGPRATRIRTNDNVNVIIPNSHLIQGPVTNWTLKGDTRRIHIPFSVAYGASRAEVREAVLAAANASPFTMPETDQRKSQVWLVGFGDSSLNFELLVWPSPEAVKRPAAMHAAYTWAIADALDAAGIEIPFPQTDLRIRSLLGREGDDALSALGLGDHLSAPQAKSSAPTVDAAPAVNDAAADLLTSQPDPIERPDD